MQIYSHVPVLTIQADLCNMMSTMHFARCDSKGLGQQKYINKHFERHSADDSGGKTRVPKKRKPGFKIQGLGFRVHDWDEQFF